MLSLFAKNMTGDLTSITLPLFQQDPSKRLLDFVIKDLAKHVSPENPSRVRIISYSNPYDSSNMDDTCYNDGCISETFILSIEDEEIDTEMKDTQLDAVWKDGGILNYILEDISLSVRIYSWCSPVYSLSDHTRRHPFFCMEFWIYPTENESDIIYSYSFALCFRTGKLLRMSSYEIIEDDEDFFMSFHKTPTWADDIYTMIRDDPMIPIHYSKLLLRACYRKWKRVLKEKSRLTLHERKLQVKYATCYVYKEKEFFKRLYKEHQQVKSYYANVLSL